MKNTLKTVAVALIVTGSAVALASCTSDAEIASANLSVDADNFKIERRIVFVNGITGDYLLSVEGKCSIADQVNQLEVTCKVGDDAYKKHFLGLSDNVTYFAEQTEAASADPYHYKVVFKPESIVTTVEPRTSVGAK